MQSKGVVYLELAMVLPVLLLAAFACLEFSNVLRIHQTAALLSREAGYSVFRRCGDIDDQATLQNCVSDAQNALYIQGTDILGFANPADGQNDLGVVISLFKYVNSCTDFDSGCETRSAVAPQAAAGLSDSTRARYHAVDFLTADGEHRPLMLSNGVVATGEVYLRYKPLIPMIGRLFLSPDPDEPERLLYESTIF